MLLFFVFLVLLFTSTRSSKVEVERNLLASLDDFAFGYSQHASQHWDCPQVSSRVGKAEESRIWRTVIPDAQIREETFMNGNVIVWEVEAYEWKKVRIHSSSSTMAKGDSSMHYVVFLSLRKPNFEGHDNSNSVKAVLSKSRRISKYALLEILLQLEQAKNKIMEQMTIYQVHPFSPEMALQTSGSLVKRNVRMPQATNYHPRVFKDAHFTTGDLVAWMALVANPCRKEQVSKLFEDMIHAFLPGFRIGLGTMPKSSAGGPAKVVYLCRAFQYVPAGADHAFYFDRNYGRFLNLQCDSIVLDCSKGIIDGQQHKATILISDADVEASSLLMHQTEAEVAMRRDFCSRLESALVLRVPSEATDAEVQAYGVSRIRSLASQLL